MDEAEDFRKKFLLELYNQLWNSVNARLTLSWQSISILIGTFAILALTEKKIVSLDYVTAILILFISWYIAHILDMSLWFNRNQAMIVNIEREFLTINDARLIFPYFLSHRKNNEMVSYYSIQISLGIGLAIIVVIFHFVPNVLSILQQSKTFYAEVVLPYIVLLGCIIFLWRTKNNRDKEYADFIETSPGKDISKEAGLSDLL